MPNVMIESIKCGCIPVMTNCLTGPKEIISKYKYGFLVNTGNIKEISESLIYALSSNSDESKIDQICTQFEEKDVLNRHEILLKVKF